MWLRADIDLRGFTHQQALTYNTARLLTFLDALHNILNLPQEEGAEQ